MGKAAKGKKGPKNGHTTKSKDGKPIAQYGGLTAGNRAPKLTYVERGIKAVDKILVHRYIAQNSHLTIGEMKEKLSKQNREHIPLLEYMIIKVMLVCAQTGDPYRLTTILDQAIGKPTQEVKISKGDDLMSMSDEELEQERKRLAEEAKLHLEEHENSERYKEMIRRFQDRVRKEAEELEQQKTQDEIIELQSSDIKHLDIEEDEGNG